MNKRWIEYRISFMPVRVMALLRNFRYSMFNDLESMTLR